MDGWRMEVNFNVFNLCQHLLTPGKFGGIIFFY